MMDNYEVFVTVAECGSFSSAAKRLGFTSSAVSKQIGRLEKKLGVQLFARTTRSLALTESGEYCFDKANAMIQQRREIESEITKFQHTPTGTLKITSTPAFGERQLIEIISGFQKKYPDIIIDLSLSGVTEDIVKRGFDIAIREGSLKDSSLLARRLTGYRTVMCAAPSFCKEKDVKDLDTALKSGLVLLNDANVIRAFSRSVDLQDRKLDGVVLKLNNLSAIRNAVLAGVGSSFLPDFMVMDDIQCGRLVEVPSGIDFPLRDVYAVYSSNQGASGKVRAFIDYCVSHFQRQSITPLRGLKSSNASAGSANHQCEDTRGETLRYQVCS